MVAGQLGGSAELLERDSEQAALEALLERARGGAGAVVVVEGPAGIGKTRLLAGALASARTSGTTVARARGGSLEQDFAFGAVRQLLEPLVAGAADPDALFTGAASTAASVLGRGEPTGADADAPGTVLHGLYWLTATLAEAGPIVLVCDDAHWFDGPSLRFLAYLANRVDELPIAVVVGTRPPEAGPEGELLARLIADQGTTRLRLKPLSETAVTSLVRASMDGQADQAFCDAVAEASRGNPFLVGELVRSAAASDGPPTASTNALLTDVTAGSAVLARLGRLPSQALELARAVAVLGPEAHLRHAATLSGLDIDQAGAAADALLRADILGPERPLAFVHPLVRSAVYNDLLPGERAARHRRAAELLIADRAGPDTVATHLMATEPAVDARVIEMLSQAARTALSQGATDVAIAYLERALAEPPSPEHRLGVVLELGAAEALATYPAAIEHFGEAIDNIDDPTTKVMLGLARGLSFVTDGRAGEGIAALERLSTSLDLTPDLALQSLAGTVLLGMTGPTATPLVTDRIAELRQRVGADTEASPSVLGVRAFAGAFANEPSVDVAAMAMRALGQIPADDPTLPVWFHLPVTVLLMADRDDEAAGILEDGLVIARRLGAPAHLGVTLFLRGWLAFRAGNLDDAEADALAALEVLDLHHVDFIVPGPLSLLVEVRRENDDLDGADALLRARGYDVGDNDSLFSLFLLRTRSRLRGGQGRIEESLADLHRGLARSEANGCRSPGFIPWHADLVMEHTRSRVPGDLISYARTALQRGEEFGAPRARAEGLRAMAVADPANDADLAKEAADTFIQHGAILEGARTQLAVAASHTDLPIDARRERLDVARDLAERAGSARLVTMIEHELQLMGGPIRRRGTIGIEALTPSERRVATLAAAGSTNKDMAQELFVTVKTVETHLAHIYQKLGIASRRELNAALAG